MADAASRRMRAAKRLCDAKNALSKACFMLEQARYEGADNPREWEEEICKIRDRIKWPVVEDRP